MENDEVTVAGLPYAFPRNQLDGFVPAEEGNLYVRLAPSGDDFLLILDARSDRKQREQRTTIISGINDSRFAKVETSDTSIGKVFCNDTPLFGCGFELYDNDVRWSVLFSRQKLSKVVEVKTKAIEIISKLRR